MFMGNFAGTTRSKARLPGIGRVEEKKAEKTAGGRTGSPDRRPREHPGNKKCEWKGYRSSSTAMFSSKAPLSF